MTLHCMQKARQAKNRRLSFLLPSILAAVSLVATVGTASVAAAVERQGTDESGTIQGMTTWKSATSSILPLTITLEQEIYGKRAPPQLLEVSPYLNNSTIALDHTKHQRITSLSASISQDIPKSAHFNQATIKSGSKTKGKSHTKAMKVFPLPYNGKRQVLRIRTTPTEIVTSRRYKTTTLIGPVQENLKPIRPDERSMSQAVTALPSTVESRSPFGGQPFLAWKPYHSGLQLSDSESYHMNMTTINEFHDGNCPSGCP